MKFQKSTLILMMSALFLSGTVYIWEKEGRPQIEAKKLKENQIFDFEEKDVQSLVLRTKDYTLQFDKNSKFGSNITEPKWRLTILQDLTKTETPKDTTATVSPTPQATESPKDKTVTASPTPQATESPKDKTATASPTPKATESLKDTTATASPTAKATEKATETIPNQIAANEPYVSYLLNLLTHGKEERIQIDPRQGDGLDNPLATIDIKLNNGRTDKLILGNSNFNNTFLYALANPPQEVKQPLEIMLVSTDFRNAVDRPLSEWKQEEDRKPNSDKGADKSTTKDSNSENKNESDKNADKASPDNTKKDDRKNSDRQGSDKANSPDTKPKTPAPEKPKR